LKLLRSDFELRKEKLLFGRYITNQDIAPIMESLSSSFKWHVIGNSVKEKPIYCLRFGGGPIKVMMWSQMHGNESTTTKAVFDFLQLFRQNEYYHNNFSFLIIPILNPDGAEAYTRVNANEVDLNRDAKDQAQPETRALFKAFHEFQPHYCFNLHGQRTIFAAGFKGKPATLSFLAPAQDAERSLSPNRIKAMTLIGGMYEDLKDELAGSIGLYDDGFNINCTGDSIQALGIPTILFEAGHFPGDYQRETTRYFILKALLSVLHRIQDYNSDNYEIYTSIPLNHKSYKDVIVRNVQISEDRIVDVGIQFEERLEHGEVSFIPKIESIESLKDYLGHLEIDVNGEKVLFGHQQEPKLESEIDFVVIKNEKILIKP